MAQVPRARLVVPFNRGADRGQTARGGVGVLDPSLAAKNGDRPSIKWSQIRLADKVHQFAWRQRYTHFVADEQTGERVHSWWQRSRRVGG